LYYYNPTISSLRGLQRLTDLNKVRHLGIHRTSLGSLSEAQQVFDAALPSAVHEQMTLAAIKQYRDKVDLVQTHNGWRYDYMTDAPWSQKTGKNHYSRGFIFGIWWNDAP